MSAQILMMGLSESGKSTFLGAFSFAAQNPPVGAPLTHSRHADEKRHIAELERAWARAREVDKTSSGSAANVQLCVADKMFGEVTLSCPDLSGEEYRLQWEDRRWSIAFSQLVREANGILMFVSAVHTHHPVFLDEESIIVQGLQEQDGQPGVDRPTPETSWSPGYACRQVQLVELLQFARAARTLTPTPLALVVSAWDLVNDVYAGPEEWLQAEVPLLHQYLETNQAAFKRRLYGVSAQGGDYRTQRDDLLAVTPQVNRIQVAHRDGSIQKSSNIALPVSWLLRQIL